MQVDERFEVMVSKREAGRSLSAILLTITESENDALHVFLTFNVQKKEQSWTYYHQRRTNWNTKATNAMVKQKIVPSPPFIIYPGISVCSLKVCRAS